MIKASRACLALIVPLTFAWACGSSTTGGDGGGAASSSGGSAGSLALGGDTVVGGDNGTTTTGGTLNGTGGTKTGTGGSTNTFGGQTQLGDTACSDGKDNDGDGLIDGFDPECTGPWDNDESTFATGIPGDNKDPKWQDCFFDGNSGAGDDGCRYATGCIDGTLKQTDPDCKLTAACVKFCAPFTPNGCDCFGCCTVQLDSGDSVDIQTVSSCSIDKIGDAKACPTCVKSAQCGNTCGTCELCPGKTVADLPAECATGAGGAGPGPGEGGAPGTPTPTYTCDNGEQVCGPNLPGCPIATYCSQGCCIQQPPR
jgi:hypothetical protein